MQKLIETSEVMRDRAEREYLKACEECVAAEQLLMKALYERDIALERTRQWDKDPRPNWNTGYDFLASE